MNYQPFCNTEIVFCTKDELIERLWEIAENVVLVCSKSAAKRWGLETVIKELQQKALMMDLSFVWVSRVNYNPTPKDVYLALETIGDRPIGVIVAIGGGSAIDLGKSISAFASERNKTMDGITKSLKEQSYTHNCFVDIIAIPTTAGTGSEVTQWATVWDQNRNAKYSIDAPGLKPRLAYIVPEFTLSLPPQITISTGLDALCHAIEAYWSRHTDPIVQEIALGAIEIIMTSLGMAIKEPHNLKIRNNLCTASVLSGIAFAKTRTTACHSISYPLTMFHDIPHGIAAAITLNSVGQLNKGYFPNDEKLFDLFDRHSGIKTWMEQISAGIVDLRLTAFGVVESDLDKIVENSFAKGRMENNPRILTENNVRQIILDVL